MPDRGCTCTAPALGDFCPGRSDIDFVVVTEDALRGLLSTTGWSARAGISLTGPGW